MTISAIAAMDRSGVIGDGGRMPWHLPRDLKRFRKITLGKPVIMGRKTFLSLRSPLAGRSNIVLSRTPDFDAPGCQVVRSIEDALSAARSCLDMSGGDEAMIIGGGDVFRETVSLWDRVYLTLVEGQFEGDAHFPIESLLGLRWRLVDHECCPADDGSPHPHQFAALKRSLSGRSTADDFDLSSFFKPSEPSRPDSV